MIKRLVLHVSQAVVPGLTKEGSVVVDVVELVPQHRKLKFRPLILTSRNPIQSSISRTWSRKLLLGHHLERPHQLRHLRQRCR
jgi:hypothetical protein